MRWVLRQGLVLIAIGVSTGLLAAFALMRLLRSLLFEVATTELSLCGTRLVLAIVALVACYIRHGERRRSIRWWRCDTSSTDFSLCT
jgi:uncharacterized membrane protein